VDNGTFECTPYKCDDGGSDCRVSCAQDLHCADGFYCGGAQSCESKKINGSPCGGSGECAEGFCVDEYCCDDSCDGDCRGCDLAGSEGTCASHAASTDPEGDCALCMVCNGAGTCVEASAGTDPLEECAGEVQATCGQDGECDGTGTCRLWAGGSVCAAASCINPSTLHEADLCDGSGSCVDSGTVDCSPYKCNDGGDACRAGCSEDGHCVDGNYCNPGGSCAAKKSNGQVCDGANECSNGVCVDGYCCDNSCDEGCESCSIPGHLGICTFHTNNTDPGGDCPVCMVCNGAGACKNAVAGSDVKEECSLEDQTSCGQDGECDGAAACRLWAGSTVCAAQSCVNPTTLHQEDLCDGLGSCVDSGTMDCSPYKCNDGGDDCRTSCTADGHCVDGNYCNATSCTAKKGNGQPCGGSNECSSDFCIDGYCCNNSCGGDCLGCDVAGSEGTCTFHTNNTDPEDECGTCKVCNGSGACKNAVAGSDVKEECDLEDSITCGQDGLCDGVGQCRFWDEATVCAAQTCSDTETRQDTSMCDGSGACVPGATNSCCPYVCEVDECRTDCTGDEHCCGTCNLGSCM